ncbi:MAG: acetyl-CoA carboxylase biotin carboxyl carrier protein [Rhodopirellula sp.]|nr:acetyl-CoA carboxylase biotin carboxyl carrier protein [Rhodopirellula sp.]
MSGTNPTQDVFDVRRIRRLVALMQEHDLSEIDLRQGDTRVVLRRGGDAAPARPAPAPVSLVPAEPVTVPAAAAPVQEEHIAVIRSPMVGTYYSAPDPDSAAFVKVGDSIGPDTTVCIVEAMKVFNQIPAEVAGKIVAVLVENGESVEFGQPLFKVDTRQ